MSAEAEALVGRALAESVRVLQQLEAHAPRIVAAADCCVRALRDGLPVLAFGNGGSAAEAQHFAAELCGRFLRERRALPALALTTDTSVLTAIGNDYAFDRVFARQVEAFARPGGVALGISTSGRSRNVIEALRTARARGLSTIALTGPTPADMGDLADIVVAVPGGTTARIQEGHLAVLHIVCDLVEAAVVAAEGEDGGR